MKKFALLLMLTFASFLARYTYGSLDRPSVVINEIAWMGTMVSANNEWLELHNTTTSPVDLSGWKITGSGGLNILLRGSVAANGFYLLERTDDNSIPNIPADQIYKGSLDNAGESILLTDNHGTLIDQTTETPWPAGNNTTKQTMERTDLGYWQTSSMPGGTPKTQNSSGASPAKSLVKTPPTYSRDITINELLPAPNGPDQINEWIELYNHGTADVSLGGWKLTDTTGTTTTYTLSDMQIAKQGYLVLKRTQTHISLNDTADGVKLLWPDDTVIDAVAYQKALADQSYNRVDDRWQWSADKTPGTANKIAVNSASEQLGKSEPKNFSLADIKQSAEPDKNASGTEKSSGNPWLLFGATLATIAIVGVLFVIVNIFKKKTHVRP